MDMSGSYWDLVDSIVKDLKNADLSLTSSISHENTTMSDLEDILGYNLPNGACDCSSTDLFFDVMDTYIYSRDNL